jgi:predicted lipoprotein with Yx(FWY)xxD motif
MKSPNFVCLSTLVAGILIAGVSCKKNSGNNNSTPPPANPTGVVLTNNSTFGNIITDNKGRTLYFFFNDAASGSSCTGSCLVSWPSFYEDNLSIGAGLNASDFGTITRTDGTKQSTFKGWPLYYFQNDAKAGDVNGDKVANLWAVAKADYTVMIANAQLVGLDGSNYNDQGVAATGASMYLTDPTGRTLYLFSKDSANHNKFTKPDLSNDPTWPMDQVTGVGSIPSVLDKTQFATITVFGKTQLACKNRPLYFFGQDNSVKGATKGVSVPTPGAGIWKVINNNTPILQ